MQGAGISPGAAGLAATEAVLQIGAGDSQRGAHYFTVIVLLPTQVIHISYMELTANQVRQTILACAAAMDAWQCLRMMEQPEAKCDIWR